MIESLSLHADSDVGTLSNARSLGVRLAEKLLVFIYNNVRNC